MGIEVFFYSHTGLLEKSSGCGDREGLTEPYVGESMKLNMASSVVALFGCIPSSFTAL